MSVQIYYFSGTGNSLHVARELQRRLPDSTLVPIIGVLKHRQIKSESDTIGMVFPIHALSVPWPVKHFLQRIDLQSASYLFAIATRICFTTVFSAINKILDKKEKSLDAYFSFAMPESYIPIFSIQSREEIVEMESAMLAELDTISHIIINRQTHRPKDSWKWLPLSHVLYPIIAWCFQKIRFPDMSKSFYSDGQCHGCGLCEKLCLSGKISMVNQRPVWQEQVACTYCFACLHYCPVKSIQIKNRKTTVKGRYHHPTIDANDIASQKHW